MTWEGWFTIAVLVAMMIVMARDLFPPSAMVIGATVTFDVAGVIDARLAFSRFCWTTHWSILLD